MSEPIPIGMIPTFHARRDPGRAFFTSGETTIRRDEFDARANRRARILAAAGIGQDDFVTIILPNGALFVEITFAIWKLGAIPQPLAATAPERERQQILDLVRPKLVVTTRPDLAGGYPFLLADAPVDETLSTEPLPPIAAQHWRATTSGGSTGRPKVIVSHGRTVLDPLQATLNRVLDGVQLNTGPLYHSGPFSNSMGGLLQGAHLIDGGKFDAANTLRLIDRHRVDWVYMVPTMMHRIWRLPAEQRDAYDYSSLKVVFHMAAACPAWLKRAWIDWLGPERILELYSGTESQGVTIIDGTEWLAHPGSVGKVQPGAELRILDAAGKPLPPGEVGEIYFLPTAGRGATYHYIGAEAKSHGDWESLGDLGYVDHEGYLYVVDRRLDMIVSGGVNVYSAEVEAALDEHPEVDCAVVIGLPDEDLGSRVHAIVQVRLGADLTETALKGFLADRIMKQKIPKAIEIVTDPLRDEAGKVRRSALQAARIANSSTSEVAQTTAA